jgi:hypothetical protein
MISEAIMERIPVVSSHLRAIGFDPENCTLEVEFLDGSIYQYQGVSQADHDALMDASSKGQYLNANIKGRYPFVKL